MATELAKAYVQIVPSANGLKGSLTNLMSGESQTAGENSGTTFGNALVGKAKTLIAAAGLGTAIERICSEAISLGMETETAYAKLETIAGSDALDGMTDSILELSNATGVACADLADTAYNAISAGASAETAMDMVTAATKLGVAGFTDSSAALSVLSTAMNAYGDAAGSVEEISDSLIMVQNLGVTTVDELSSSIGKAIATGGAYNVSLGNIESAYVSMTKSGIDTQQSTTYLNNMLNELGDSGSTVSDILQEQTGKSFSELMDSGSSLGDVLGILYDYCDGDATAMNNLWSSSTAGLAATAIVNQGLDEFNGNLEAITDSAGATEEAYSIMADTTEFKMDAMKTSFENLGLSIFDGLEEPMRTAIDFVTESVIPGIQDLMEWLSEKLSPVFDALSEVIDAFISFVSTIWSGWGDDIMGGTDGAFSNIISIVTNALDAVQGIIEFITAIISGDWSGAWEAIKGVFSSIWEAIKTIVSNALQTMRNIISTIWNAIKTLISNVLNGIKTKFTTIFDSIKTKISNVFNSIKTTISNAMNSVKTSISNIINKIKSLFTNLVNKAKTWAKDMIDNFIQGIKDKISAVGDAVKGVASTVKSFLGFSLPETGPLADADTYMPDFMGLLAEGITGNEEKVIDSMESLAGEVADAASFDSGDVSVGGASYQMASGSDSRVEEILSLMEQYLPMLANMQVVMDSGELVGATAQKMNTELGRISAKEARRG